MTDQGATVILVEFIESRIDFVFNLPKEILHRQDTFRVPSPIFSVSAKEESSSEGRITVSARWGEMNGFRLFEAMFCFFRFLPGSDCPVEQRTRIFFNVCCLYSTEMDYSKNKKTLYIARYSYVPRDILLRCCKLVIFSQT